MPNYNTIHTTHGALFLGLVLSTILYGVTLLQSFLYYRQYPNDPRVTKSLVFLLWVLDTAHLILCIITVYHYLVSNFNNPEALSQSTWSINVQAACNILIGLLVQCFFALRVWAMSRNKVVTVVIIIFVCIHFGEGVALIVEAFRFGISRFQTLVWVGGTGLGCAAATDIISAAALCYYLNKSRTGLAGSESLISTLILYSITTGMITSVVALICVFTFAVMPTNYVWIAFFWIIGKCYVNSLLAALNCRESLREKINRHDSNVLRLAPISILASTGGLESSLEAQTDSEEVTNQKNTYIAKEDPVLVVNVPSYHSR